MWASASSSETTVRIERRRESYSVPKLAVLAARSSAAG